MNKKLMAVAVAGALAAPAVAFAQASSVQIYGRANLGLDTISATGATIGSAGDIKSRTRVFDQGSRLGFRGTENLGNGLKAVFQIESGVNIDNGGTTGQNGAANASTGTLASRDSFGGIAGNFGQVTFGRQSVWWTNANDLTQANYINVGLQFNTGGVGRLAGPSARTNNVMQYQTPVWGGFQATVAYAPQSEASAAGLNTDGKLWGATFLWRGPVVLQWDVAKKSNTSAIVGGATQPQQVITGNKVGIGWAYVPNAMLSLNWMKYQNDKNAAVAGFNAAGDNLSQTAWQINWTHMFGNLQGIAQYARSNNVSGCSVVNGCSNTSSNAYMLAAKYHLSTRTGVYVSYTQISNDSNQIADYNGGNMGTPGVSAGADPRIFAVGVLHNF